MPFVIKNFNQIGIQDPFAEETPKKKRFKVPTDITQEVYDVKQYLSADGPKCIYIPSAQLMFQMMRGCLGVKRAEDLWVVQAE